SWALAAPDKASSSAAVKSLRIPEFLPEAILLSAPDRDLLLPGLGQARSSAVAARARCEDGLAKRGDFGLLQALGVGDQRLEIRRAEPVDLLAAPGRDPAARQDGGWRNLFHRSLYKQSGVSPIHIKGIVTPTSASRVRSCASRSSLQPSVRAGRIGRTT